MKYNCEEYIQLLTSQQALKKQNKSLKTEDPIKYSKLRKYSAKISEYLHWSQKNQYLQLIKDFLNYKIDGKEFDNKFSKMVTVIERKSSLLSKNYQELKCIEPSSMSLGFGTWISEIYLCCNEFYSDFNEEEDRAEIPFAKTEEQLRDAVKSLFPEIQKYCEE
jgi:hypothetical protein